MPAIAAIAIADGKVSPATHTFSPTTTNGQKGSLDNRSGPFPAAFENLTVEVVKPSSPTGAYRLTATLKLPITATDVGGVERVARFAKTDVTMHFSQESTEAERKDACALLSNLFANATMMDVVAKLEPLY